MKSRWAFWLLALLAVTYLVLLFVIPTAATGLSVKYQLSTAQARLLGLSVALPLIAIWFIAWYGYSLFRGYASSITNSPEGHSFSRIADGLLVLAFSLPARAVLSQISNWLIYTHPGWTTQLVIIQNYIFLTFMFVSLLLIFIGSRGLYKLINRRSIKVEIILTGAFTLAAAAFWNLTLTDTARSVPSHDIARASYYLSDFWLIVTILIPYTVCWLAGLLAVYYVRQYRTYVSGTIYRQALASTSAGMIIAIISFMLIQYLTSLNSALNRATLQAVLLLVYLLLVAFGIGFALLAAGAKKLRWLEEV